MTDLIVKWTGTITIVVALALACFALCAWLIAKAINSIRMIRSVFRVYWNFYNTIKDLPPGNYTKYRVTWDREKERFIDPEGIR